jgi:hypothetical protein
MYSSRVTEDTIGSVLPPIIDASPYKENMETEIVKLLNMVFTRWPKHELTCDPLDHWRWKYTDNPSGKLLATTAKVDNTIIGCDHRTFNNIRIFNKKLLSTIEADSAVHPNYQGIGVFKKMDKITTKTAKTINISLSYWITVNPILIEWAKRHKSSQFPFELVNMIWINNMEKYLQRRKSSFKLVKKLGHTVVKRINQLSNKRGKPRKDYTIETVTMFDSRANDFWEENHEHYDFIVERDQDSLNYRYCDPRSGNYHIKAIFSDSLMRGFCVYTQETVKGCRVGKILDFLINPGHKKAGDILLRDILNHFIENQINSVNFWVVKYNWLEKIFKNNNFLSSSDGLPHIFFESISPASGWDQLKDSNQNRIHFVMGDTDIN